MFVERHVHLHVHKYIYYRHAFKNTCVVYMHICICLKVDMHWEYMCVRLPINTHCTDIYFAMNNCMYVHIMYVYVYQLYGYIYLGMYIGRHT